MHIEPIYSLSFVVITLLIIYFFVKRLSKGGCIAYGYIGLIIFCINLFTVLSLYFTYITTNDVYAILTSGEKYDAKVVNFTSEQRYKADDGTSYIMRTPIVKFTTNQGKEILRELNFSTSGLEIGDRYVVNYNAANDKIITLGFILIIEVVASFIFCFLFTFLFIGILMYSLGYSTAGYKELISKIGLKFFVPFLMIGFNALLIYGVFYGNEVPLWATVVLIFFSVMLGLGTIGYIKMVFFKGKPKINRVGSNKRVGNRRNKNQNKKIN